MRAALPWPTRELIRGSFKISSGTGTLSTPSGTRRPTPRGLKGYGADGLLRLGELQPVAVVDREVE
jgi:hypothetical protein